MSEKSRSFLSKLLPIGITSVGEGFNTAIRDFGFINFLKISFFVIWRFIKYKAVLAFIPKKPDFVEKDILGGKMLLQRFHGGISWDLLVNGIREPKSTRFLPNEIKPGMNVLEAGANIGYYLIQEARMVGEEGHIYAFEPDPNNIDLLNKNIALNEITNVTFNPAALGNQEGKIKFNLADRGNLSGFTFETDKSVDVQMYKGDEILKGKRIDYVRMDVEGFELEILKGLENLLKESVKGLFIEIHPTYLLEHGSSLEHFLGWLDERGFKIVKAFSDYDWNSAEFDNASDLVNYKYAEKMVWRAFFRKEERT